MNFKDCVYNSQKIQILPILQYIITQIFTKEYYLLSKLSKLHTLESGINLAPGNFGKKNKHSPIYTLYLYYLNRLYEVRNKAVAPGKKSKN